MRVLIIGGSKSGKSHAAQDIAKKLDTGEKLYYFATMKPVDGEDVERIEKHIIDRAGMGFLTVERSKNILEGEALCENSTVLFDSVTALLSNEMFQTDERGGFFFDGAAPQRVLGDIAALSRRVKNFVVVADDILRGGGNFDEYTDAFLKGLARILCGFAAEADIVLEASCGRLIARKGAEPFEGGNLI